MNIRKLELEPIPQLLFDGLAHEKLVMEQRCGYMGISRGPDTRSPEVRAAADRIETGYGDFDHAIFRCKECGQSSGISIEHLPTCRVGKVLANAR